MSAKNDETFGDREKILFARGSQKMKSNTSYFPLSNVKSMSFLVSQSLVFEYCKAKKFIR